MSTLWEGKEVGIASSVDALQMSRSTFGNIYSNFETLVAQIVTALKKIIQNSNFRRQRPTYWCKKLNKMTDSFAAGRSHVRRCSDLLSFTLRGDLVHEMGYSLLVKP